MTIRRQIIRTLRSGEAHRIHFTFTGENGHTVTVDHTSFVRVSNEFERRNISIVEGHFPGNIAMYSARAERGLAANTLYLGNNPRSSRIFDALVVHESVHASFDFARSSLPWIDNEAAAYIAQGFYLRNSGFHREWLDMASLPSIGYEWVNDVKDGGDGAFFLDAIRTALRRDRQYHDYIGGNFDGDG